MWKTANAGRGHPWMPYLPKDRSSKKNVIALNFLHGRFIALGRWLLSQERRLEVDITSWTVSRPKSSLPSSPIKTIYINSQTAPFLGGIHFYFSSDALMHTILKINKYKYFAFSPVNLPVVSCFIAPAIGPRRVEEKSFFHYSTLFFVKEMLPLEETAMCTGAPLPCASPVPLLHTFCCVSKALFANQVVCPWYVIQ